MKLKSIIGVLAALFVCVAANFAAVQSQPVSSTVKSPVFLMSSSAIYTVPDSGLLKHVILVGYYADEKSDLFSWVSANGFALTTDLGAVEYVLQNYKEDVVKTLTLQRAASGRATMKIALVEMSPPQSAALSVGTHNTKALFAPIVPQTDDEMRSALSVVPAQMINESIRAKVGSGDKVVILGFVVQNRDNDPNVALWTKRLLVRAVGPGLSNLGVTNPTSDPRIDIFHNVNGQNVLVASNENWGAADKVGTLSTPSDQKELERAATAVGGFQLQLGSKDAAYVGEFPPGVYSVVISAKEEGKIALAEIYDVSGDAGYLRLCNMSCRAIGGTGDDNLILGVVREGVGAHKLLIRAVGPTLADKGWLARSDVMVDPKFTIVSGKNVTLGMNDDWGTEPATVASSAAVVGAFPLTAGSKDAAQLYTDTITGVNSIMPIITGTGIALCEIYEVP